MPRKLDTTCCYGVPRVCLVLPARTRRGQERQNVCLPEQEGRCGGDRAAIGAGHSRLGNAPRVPSPHSVPCVLPQPCTRHCAGRKSARSPSRSRATFSQGLVAAYFTDFGFLLSHGIAPGSVPCASVKRRGLLSYCLCRLIGARDLPFTRIEHRFREAAFLGVLSFGLP